MNRNKSTILGLLSLSLLAGCGSKPQETVVKLDPSNPTVVTIWHYYKGDQQRIFDELITQFNETEGHEKGIIVEGYNKGGVNELSDAVLSSAHKEVGADPLPAVFAAYPDCAFEVDNLGLVSDLCEYLTGEEINAYMDAYIEEGRFNGDDLKLFPVAKSTEILLINETEWNEFASATGATKESLKTWEGIVDVSKSFYEWSNGKSFFGRDAFANYMLIGSKQLGNELFKVENGEVTFNIDETTMRRLWDNYYVPYVNGWFGAYGKFRSDDIKTGQLFALVGSTSGATYFPSEVTLDDGSTEPIECGIYALPNFEGTTPTAVQQGAGFVVSKTDEKTEYASTIFLKWMTKTENNIEFAVSSGYMPVTKEANNPELLTNALKEEHSDELLCAIMNTGAEVTSTYELYTPKPFAHGTEARSIVNNHMQDWADNAVTRRNEMMASGMSKEEAIAELTSDEEFHAWLSDFTDALNNSIKD